MKELSCGFIIINRKNPKQILACQPNGRRPNTPGNYDIPKGHRENGETTLETLDGGVKYFDYHIVSDVGRRH